MFQHNLHTYVFNSFHSFVLFLLWQRVASLFTSPKKTISRSCCSFNMSCITQGKSQESLKNGKMHVFFPFKKVHNKHSPSFHEVRTMLAEVDHRDLLTNCCIHSGSKQLRCFPTKCSLANGQCCVTPGYYSYQRWKQTCPLTSVIVNPTPIDWIITAL